MNQDFEKYSDLPLEVRLAWEVMTCRAIRSTYDAPDHACQWFNRHYGPYPAYDWINDLPPLSPEDGKEEKEFEAYCVGERFQVPELMSGCRKAPIMTIGINPNLTAYYPSSTSATWCYPYFDDISQYAYYFRHRAVCQEHFSLDFIKENVTPGTQVLAEKDGQVDSAEWSPKTGGLSLTLKYSDDSYKTLQLDPGYKVLASPDGFKAGETVAGKIAIKEKTKTTLYRKPVGYYERFASIFETFKKLAGPEVQELPLQMGEDVCQADMVACASPGWGAWFTDTAREGITRECVHQRKWLIMQLLQTEPKMIVFSGSAAFSMFYDLMKDYIVTDLDLESDTFELLKKSINDEILLKIDLGDGSEPLRARIAISPHFSYSTNFQSQSRFTLEEWELYSLQYPESFKKLNKIVQAGYGGGTKIVFMEGDNAPTEAEVGADVWKILQDHFYNAQEMVAEIIVDEYKKENLLIQGEHFKRTDGPCKFCGNQLFAFKEGCPYGKLGPAPTIAEAVDNKIIDIGERIIKWVKGFTPKK